MANPFSKLFQWVGGVVKKSYWTYLGSVLYGEMVNKPTNRDYLDAYEASFLVNACVRKISEKVANTKFKLYEVSGSPGKERITEKKNHPLLDLLAQVNPFVTKFEMLDLTQTYIELLGNAYWLKVRAEGGKGKPLELWQLRPDWVTVMEDPEKIVKEYKYQLPNGTFQTFKTEDVIQFKQPNPKSSIYGLPTVKAAIEVIKSSIFITRWNMNFFYNMARPDGLLIYKNKMGDPEKKEIMKQWAGDYQGVEKAHKTGFAFGDVDYKDLNMTMKEMEFAKLNDTVTQQILTAFGVPKPIVMMTNDLNRATAEAAIYAFLSETVEPKIRRIIDRLNEFLVPEYGDNLYLDFDDPTPELREATMLEYDNALRNNWMLINEVRDREGLPPIEGGWDIYLPITSVPVGGASEENKTMKKDMPQNYVVIKGIDPKEYKKQKEEREQEVLRDKVLVGKRKLKLEMQLKEELRKVFTSSIRRSAFGEVEKKAIWIEHDKILNTDTRFFKMMTKTLFKKQAERVQDALKSGYTGRAFLAEVIKKGVSLIDWDVEKTLFTQVSLPVYTEIIKHRGQRAARLVGAEMFDITDRIKKFIDRKASMFADEVNDTTREALKNALKEGIDAGEGIDELSGRVADVFKTREGYDSERIARTEVISASGEADVEAYKQSEVVEKKEWLATMDDRVRETHAEVNGEAVGLDDEFSNGLKFPGDPAGDPDETVNCRCTLLPVLEK